ncbi:hypothetical protein C8D92_102424 [Tamilnaduibacter salinus]|uniref:Uncharacterized protein n=1 Tax=Tamilnaduibacter salinus TaxID=1484056 RepID=A0A2U1D013_9GAMM|nr:hypothetical protein C8D92_102424 [Tamilnaduibacter salinus]
MENQSNAAQNARPTSVRFWLDLYGNFALSQ